MMVAVDLRRPTAGSNHPSVGLSIISVSRETTVSGSDSHRTFAKNYFWATCPRRYWVHMHEKIVGPTHLFVYTQRRMMDFPKIRRINRLFSVGLSVFVIKWGIFGEVSRETMLSKASYSRVQHSYRTRALWHSTQVYRQLINTLANTRAVSRETFSLEARIRSVLSAEIP